MHTKLYIQMYIYKINQSIQLMQNVSKVTKTIRSLLFEHHFTCVIKCYLPQ